MSPTSLPTRKIGDSDVSAIGFGAMGLSAFYGKAASDAERLGFLDTVYARGCTFWDTADAYHDNEDLIGKWFKRSGKRNEIFLATKFGFTPDKEKLITGDPEYVRAAFAKSIARLGVESVDLYYAHRTDVTIPIEKTVAAMAELVKAGKVKYLGLSECSANTLRRAHAVHPIAAIQVEYSPFTLDIEDEKIAVLKTARELGVAIIAYSPLGRGLITGQYKSVDDFEADDFRRVVPRYQNENFPNILKLADGLKKVGVKHGATAGQVAIAWLLAQGPDVIPIPGTRQVKYLDENLGALKVVLTPEDLAEVRALALEADGANKDFPRYPEYMVATLFPESPALV
ncbi:hypothetical protein PLICRDRAFT_177438 [Plicaturopsis crispa FD-325 SS-3]|nr:hypothetical protein PLICRDRAFT_177438 [Plicaturopsis crispa FD-325 SS-3]